jgi:hypothetical protein
LDKIGQHWRSERVTGANDNYLEDVQPNRLKDLECPHGRRTLINIEERSQKTVAQRRHSHESGVVLQKHMHLQRLGGGGFVTSMKLTSYGSARSSKWPVRGLPLNGVIWCEQREDRVIPCHVESLFWRYAPSTFVLETYHVLYGLIITGDSLHSNSLQVGVNQDPYSLHRRPLSHHGFRRVPQSGRRHLSAAVSKWVLGLSFVCKVWCVDVEQLAQL